MLIRQALASASLFWSVYSITTPIHLLLDDSYGLWNPFHLGVLFLVSGCSSLLGSVIGWYLRSYNERLWTAARGFAQPEDGLRSAVVFLGVIEPASLLGYGWALHYDLGGKYLPAIMIGVQCGVQSCVTSIVDDCTSSILPDVRERRAAAGTLASNLMAGVSTASTSPAIGKLRIGPFSSLGAGVLICVAMVLCFTVRYGEGLRKKAEERLARWEREESAASSAGRGTIWAGRWWQRQRLARQEREATAASSAGRGTIWARRWWGQR